VVANSELFESLAKPYSGMEESSNDYHASNREIFTRTIGTTLLATNELLEQDSQSDAIRLRI
jgi:hypothetical protein